MNEFAFKDYSAYYNLLNSGKNYGKEVEYIIELFKKYGNKGKKILELGSGTGKHAEVLINKGFNVEGIEISNQMIEISKKISNFNAHLGDITNFDLNKSFDYVISMFHVMSYLTSNESINDVFINANKHLKINGLFIFDFWFTPAVINLKPSSRTKLFKSKNLVVERKSYPTCFHDKNRVDINFKIKIKENNVKKTIEELHSMRHFSIPELCYFASKSGFSFIKAEEFITKKTVSEKTWGVCIIFKKIK